MAYGFEDLIADEMATTGQRGRPKSDERIALEALPIGKCVRFPKLAIARPSLEAMAYTVRKNREVRFVVRDRGDHWLVAAFDRSGAGA